MKIKIKSLLIRWLGIFNIFYRPFARLFFWRRNMLCFNRFKFLESDIEIPIATKYVDGVHFMSKQVVAAYAEYASITLYAKGDHAGCSKDVVFTFATYDKLRNLWDTTEYLVLKVTASGTSEVQRTIPINPDMDYLKLLSIENQETVEGYTVDANVTIFLKEK